MGKPGALEDRPGHRVDVGAAILARVAGTVGNAMVRSDFLALDAVDTVGPALIEEELQADIISGEVAVKIPSAVPFHLESPRFSV